MSPLHDNIIGGAATVNSFNNDNSMAGEDSNPKNLRPKSATNPLVFSNESDDAVAVTSNR